MIEVRVTEHERVGSRRPIRKLAVLPIGLCSVALKQAAVEHDVDSPHVDAMQ
jgi:hypothetical protein